MMLLEIGELLSKQHFFDSTLSKHFEALVDSLQFFSWLKDTSMSAEKNKVNSIICIIKKFALHQIIKAIRKKLKTKGKFSFSVASIEIENKNVCLLSSIKVQVFFKKNQKVMPVSSR